MCNTYRFSTATMDAGKRLNGYAILTLPVLYYTSFGFLLQLDTLIARIFHGFVLLQKMSYER